MPDISNEDLMKLILRVGKNVNKIEEKVEILEEKLDELLLFFKDKRKPSQIPLNKDDLGELDYGFKFSPIRNHEELSFVSNKITKDERYRKNLLLLLQSREKLRLTHLFDDEFLMDYNLTGKRGKTKLQGLVPFDEVFMYLKLKSGATHEEIQKELSSDLDNIRRWARMKQKKRLETLEKNTCEPPNSQESVTTEPRIQSDIHIENIEYLSEYEDEITEAFIEESSEPKSEPEEIFVEEAQQQESLNEEMFDGFYQFTPIKNEKELKIVSERIQSNPEYLKQLRIQLIEESKDGHCTLEQLFSIDFLINFGKRTPYNRRLYDLVPFKQIYFYLKRHLGLSSKQIESGALVEIAKIRNRLRQCQRRIKRTLPSSDKSFTKNT